MAYREKGVKTWTNLENTTKTSQTVESLASGTDYEVRVRAANADGVYSKWSAAKVVKVK